MPSIVWNRHPEEAYLNPYEYDAQEQFVREARKLLKSLFVFYDRFNLTFSCDDRSLRKSIWMLQIDALDSLRDCLEALTLKKHRTAGRLFRDVIETLDLAAYLHSGSPAAQVNLQKWYDDEVIPHRKYRDHIRKTLGEKPADERRDFYSQLSKFTHRTYRALLKGYSLGGGDLMVYDSHHASGSLVLPQTIAGFYAILADLIALFCHEACVRGVLTLPEVDQARKASLEVETFPRQFAQI
jgi:hypothetical protein